MRKFSLIYWAYRNKITNKLWGVVHAPCRGKKRGSILISYLTGPFTLAPSEYFTDPHSSYWECSEIVHLFSKRGYNVDIINWNNKTFLPKKKYKLCLDIQNNLERLSKFLPKECVKIIHIVSANSKFQNNAERKRLNDLKNRRGVILKTQRTNTLSENTTYADFIEGFGNRTIHCSYKISNKPIFPIPISVVCKYDFPKNKNFKLARKNFLWFGGGGAILKGLDLVVEAFSRLPNLNLYIIGPAPFEKEFSKEYKKELNLPNIHHYPRPKISKNGSMTIEGQPFIKIMNRCVAIIYPSASEGTSGAVIQAMHAGIIPIITREAGLSKNSPSIIIENPSVESIISLAQKVSETNPATLYNTAHDSWKYVNQYHTKKKFSESYANFIDNIIKL